MPRNQFEDNGVPEENLGGLYDEPTSSADALLQEVEAGKMSINEARKVLGLPVVETADLLDIPVPPEEDIQDTLSHLRGNEGFTTTAQHLERLREPSRWERG